MVSADDERDMLSEATKTYPFATLLELVYQGWLVGLSMKPSERLT